MAQEQAQMQSPLSTEVGSIHARVNEDFYRLLVALTLANRRGGTEKLSTLYFAITITLKENTMI
jgi:hypothetical protein